MTTQSVPTPTGRQRVDVPAGVRVIHAGQGDQYALRCAAMVRRLAIGAQFDPYVVGCARSIVRTVPPRDYDGYCRAIRYFLTRVTPYVRDVRDADNISSPHEQLRSIEETGETLGDCDDAAALAAGLGLAVGCDARLTLVAFVDPTAPYEHIFAELQGEPGGPWWDMDTTKPPGPLPPISRSYTVEV